MEWKIKANKLELNDKPVTFRQSPNGGADLNPRYLIIHYTAGTRASSAINHFLNSASKNRASAHLVLDRDGTVTQMMDFNKVAWHAGKSQWEGIIGLNRHSIGIEIVNAGKLRKSATGKWLTWSNNEIDPEEVIIDTHKHESSSAGWHAYTEAQIEAVIGIGIALRDKYDLLDVLGHEDISKGRKVDPGPAFPQISVQSQIMGRDD